MAAKFILNEKTKGCFQFTFHAPDDQVLLTSPFFADKGTALRRIDTVRSLARRGRNLSSCSTGDGQYFLVLKDNQGKLLGQSCIFNDRQNLQKALDVIKKCSPKTSILDRTRQSGADSSSPNLLSSGIVQNAEDTPSRIVLKQNAKGYYSFTCQSPDGKVLLTSPFFTDKNYTLSRVALARSLAQKQDSFEVRTAESGQLYVVLTNTNHEIVARSPQFSNIRTMRKWTASIKDYVCAGMLYDRTRDR